MRYHVSGLSFEEVANLKKQGKDNVIPKLKSKSNVHIILGHTFTMFNLFNIIIAMLLFYVGEPLSTLFLGINIMNIGIRSYQEIRAKKVVESLTILISKDVKVIREGSIHEVLSEDIVLGDHVIYQNGDQIAADAIVLEDVVEVNESNLTGESIPVVKTAGDTLLSGSFIVSGSCLAKTTRVGVDSFAQKITLEARNYIPIESQLMKTFMAINQVCTWLVLPVGTILVYQSMGVRDINLHDTVLSTSTVLLGLLPKGLVLLTSLSFMISVFRLAQKRTLVQEIYSIETMSKVDVLCIDKTGTLTQGDMVVQSIESLGNPSEVYDMMALYVSNSKDVDSTSQALRRHIDHPLTQEASSILPFSSLRKWGSMTFKDQSFYLGAPDVLVPNYNFSNSMLSYQKQGARVLMFAKGSDPLEGSSLPQDIEPLALIALSDPVRLDVRDALDFFNENDVLVKVISGDNIETLKAIACQAGIENGKKAIDIRGLETDEALEDAILNYNVIGRASPHQKQRMVQILQAKGKIVGMVGDGVNDVLALRSANVSVAMGSGSAAARQASQIVLLENEFKTMKDVVMEGRLVTNNISRSASLYYMGTFFTFLLACVAMILNTPYPFAPVQISLMSMFVEGMPSTLVTFEASYAKPKENVMVTVARNIIPIGSVMTLSFIYLLRQPLEVPIRNTMLYYLVVYFSFLLVLQIFQPLSLRRVGVLIVSATSFVIVSLIVRSFVHISALNRFLYTDLLLMCLIGTAIALVVRWFVSRIVIKRGLSLFM